MATTEPQIKWEKPKVVWDWEKQERRKLCWNLWLFTTKGVWLVWVFVLPFTYYWGRANLLPSDFANVFKLVALLGLLFPTLFALLSCTQLLPKLFRKRGGTYALNSKSALYNNWNEGWSISWKRIESYRFIDHSILPGIRVLQLKVKSVNAGLIVLEGTWCDFDFDPAITPETDIEAVIRHYLTPA